MYDLIYVTAQAMLGVADSSDAGDDPDLVPSVGTVVFTPSITGPTTLLSTQQILSLGKVTAELDAQGRLRPPVDGVSAPPSVAGGNLSLIGPKSAELLDTGWTWGATFKPANGQTWAQFTVSGITGNPGETVALTTMFPTTATQAVKQALVYFLDTPPTADTLPTGLRVGVDQIIAPNPADNNELTLWKVS